MAGGFENQSAVAAGDGADRVHQAFRGERAAIGVRRTSAARSAFFGGRADTTAQPRGGTTEEYLIRVRPKRTTPSLSSGKRSKIRERLGRFSRSVVMTRGKSFVKLDMSVGNALNSAAVAQTGPARK